MPRPSHRLDGEASRHNTDSTNMDAPTDVEILQVRIVNELTRLRFRRARLGPEQARKLDDAAHRRINQLLTEWEAARTHVNTVTKPTAGQRD